MKEVLICILDQYADWEVSYVSTLLLSLGQGKFGIKTVSLTKEPVKSLGGITVIPDCDINSVPEDFEAVLLIGGMSWRQEQAKAVEPLVFKALEKGKIVGGICDAVGFLATMGVLNDVFHTGNGVVNLQNWENSKYLGEEKFVSKDAVETVTLLRQTVRELWILQKKFFPLLMFATKKKSMNGLTFIKTVFIRLLCRKCKYYVCLNGFWKG